MDNISYIDIRKAVELCSDLAGVVPDSMRTRKGEPTGSLPVYGRNIEDALRSLTCALNIPKDKRTEWYSRLQPYAKEFITLPE